MRWIVDFSVWEIIEEEEERSLIGVIGRWCDDDDGPSESRHTRTNPVVICMTTMIIVYQHHRWSRSSIVAAAHGWTSSKNAWNAPSQTFGTPRKLQTKKDERKKWRTGSDWYARRVRFELFFFFFLIFPNRPSLLSACAREFFHGFTVMSFGVNFPLAPLMARGNGMPCLACLLAVHVLAASLSKVFFILFYFFFFGWTRTPWTGGGSGWRDRRTDRRFFLFFLFPPRKNQIFFFLFISTTTAGIIFCAGHTKVAVTRLVCCDIGRRLHAGRKTMAQPVSVPNGQRARSIISRGRKTFSFFFSHFSSFFFCKYITSSGHLVWLAIIIVWPPAKS